MTRSRAQPCRASHTPRAPARLSTAVGPQHVLAPPPGHPQHAPIRRAPLAPQSRRTATCHLPCCASHTPRVPASQPRRAPHSPLAPAPQHCRPDVRLWPRRTSHTPRTCAPQPRRPVACRASYTPRAPRLSIAFGPQHTLAPPHSRTPHAHTPRAPRASPAARPPVACPAARLIRRVFPRLSPAARLIRRLLPHLYPAPRLSTAVGPQHVLAPPPGHPQHAHTPRAPRLITAARMSAAALAPRPVRRLLPRPAPPRATYTARPAHIDNKAHFYQIHP